MMTKEIAEHLISEAIQNRDKIGNYYQNSGATDRHMIDRERDILKFALNIIKEID